MLPHRLGAHGVRAGPLLPRTVAQRRLQCRSSAPAQADTPWRTATQQPRKPAGCQAVGSRHRGEVAAPPPGVEANNAVVLQKRRRQQHETDRASLSASSSADAASLTQQAAQTEAANADLMPPGLAAAPEVKPAAAGSVLGAIALITGSTVGAGILALPEVSAPAGAIPSTGGASCLALWTYICDTAAMDNRSRVD